MSILSSLRSFMFSPQLLISVALSACSGCTELLYGGYDNEPPRPNVVDADVSLDTMRPSEIEIEVSQWNPNTPSLFAKLDYHNESKRAADGALCPRFPGLVAKLDGVEITMASRGGWSPDYNTYCRNPYLRVSVPPTPTSAKTLTIGDTTQTLSFDLGDALGLRSASLVAPPAGGWRVGETVTVRWSPASDLAKAVSLRLRSVGTVTDVVVPPENVTYAAGAFSFPLPAGLSVGQVAYLSMDKAESGVACGEGCKLDKRYILELPVDVRAP